MKKTNAQRVRERVRQHRHPQNLCRIDHHEGKYIRNFLSSNKHKRIATKINTDGTAIEQLEQGRECEANISKNGKSWISNYDLTTWNLKLGTN